MAEPILCSYAGLEVRRQALPTILVRVAGNDDPVFYDPENHLLPDGEMGRLRNDLRENIYCDLFTDEVKQSRGGRPNWVFLAWKYNLKCRELPGWIHLMKRWRIL